MESIDFKNEVNGAINESFEFIRQGFFNGKIKFSNTPSYTPFLRFAESNTHFIAEPHWS